MRTVLRPLVALVGSLSIVSAVGCASAPDGSVDETGIETGQTEAMGEALSKDSAVSRAEEWANVELHYCQSPRGQYDGDVACWGHEGSAHRCVRTANSRWDAYRSDCSGLVSWAWGLPSPGRVTTELAPFQNDISHVIPASQLAPGDAVNNANHVMLFKKWDSPGVATFIEEPGCSSSKPFAHETTSSVSIQGSSIYVSAHGSSFTAIRFNRIGSSGGGAPTGGGSHGGGSTGGGSSGGGGSEALGCHSSTLGRAVPADACVQSRSDSRWYQCERGAWVDRWTDPDACNGQYPL